MLQPSISEGLSIDMLEAMGCGLPVITTGIGGSPEVVQHRRNGWLLESVDPDAVADVLAEAWSRGPDGLRRMGEAARADVRARFSPERYIAELDALYDDLLAR